MMAFVDTFARSLVSTQRNRGHTQSADSGDDGKDEERRRTIKECKRQIQTVCTVCE
jgi:hypothetical protein